MDGSIGLKGPNFSHFTTGHQEMLGCFTGGSALLPTRIALPRKQ